MAIKSKTVAQASRLQRETPARNGGSLPRKIDSAIDQLRSEIPALRKNGGHPSISTRKTAKREKRILGIDAAYGAFAGLEISSEQFARSKQEEIELEARIRRQ